MDVLLPNPTPGDHDLNGLKLTLPKDITQYSVFFWPNGFSRRFLKNVQTYLLFEKGLGPIFDKLESLLFKDSLGQVWLKLT